MTNVLGCNLEMVDKQFDSGQRSMSESEKDQVGSLKSLKKKEESNAWLTQPKPSRPDCSFSTMKMTYPTWYPLRMKSRSQEVCMTERGPQRREVAKLSAVSIHPRRRRRCAPVKRCSSAGRGIHVCSCSTASKSRDACFCSLCRPLL